MRKLRTMICADYLWLHVALYPYIRDESCRNASEELMRGAFR